MTTAPPRPDTAIATRQSLAHGPLCIALLHIERARQGLTSWETVHQQLAVVGPLIDGKDTSLFLGAPAMAYVLHQAAADSGRYAGALHTLDQVVAAETSRRLNLDPPGNSRSRAWT
ncbi:lanthionine synthetase LanC family protein [Streptomyces sp. NPDC002144]